jgi:hypothetical protein
VTYNILERSSLADGFLDHTLKNRFVNVMPTLFAGLGVLTAILLGENPLQAKVLRSVGIIALEGVR